MLEEPQTKRICIPKCLSYAYHRKKLILMNHVDILKINLYVELGDEKMQTEKENPNKSPFPCLSLSLNQSLKNQSVIIVRVPAAGITKWMQSSSCIFSQSTAQVTRPKAQGAQQRIARAHATLSPLSPLCLLSLQMTGISLKICKAPLTELHQIMGNAKHTLSKQSWQYLRYCSAHAISG